MVGTGNGIKDRVRGAIRDRGQQLLDLVDRLAAEAERGYEEFRTSEMVSEQLSRLSCSVREGLAVTGLRADFGNGAGTTVALVGELDALPIDRHPDRNARTGAAHACGHHLQLAIALAAAAGLDDAGVFDRSDGRLAVIATPAEESVDVERKLRLRSEETIRYFGGKQEMIRLGVFDGVDAALLVHASGRTETRAFGLEQVTVSHMIKNARFTGRAAHAGAAPEQGINALRAATLALGAIDACRERYVDGRYIRVHPVLSAPETAVNAVPSDVRLESYVRGRTGEDVDAGNTDFDRAMLAGALALGGAVEIESIAGYLPIVRHHGLESVVRANAQRIVGADNVGTEGLSAATTDFGDLTSLIPAIQATAGGMTGMPHTPAFVMNDFERAVLHPAEILACTVIDLFARGVPEDRSFMPMSRPAWSDVLDRRSYRLRFDATDESLGVRSAL